MTTIPAELTAPPRPTFSFVNGHFPRRRTLVLLAGVLGGLFLAYAWKSSLVDDQIGFHSARAMLGHDAVTTPIGGIASGILFAFVTGLAGSFTACNIAVFGAVGPLVGQAETRRARLGQTLAPLGWLSAGMLPVSALYGAIVGIVGTRMPQYSTAKFTGISPKVVQIMATFGFVGTVMILCGLSALGVIRDPLGPLTRRFPHAPLVVMGSLVGLFLVGRPYPLFRAMFRHAAQTHNPAYGAFAFALQSVGNIVIMGLLFMLLSYGVRGRLQRWLAAKPSRISVLTSVALLVAGVFTVVYWDVRLLHRLGYIWFPTAPWS